MRTQTNTDLREKILNLLKEEAQGMTLREVSLISPTLEEVQETLTGTAIINPVGSEAGEEPTKQILPPFEPTLHGFMVDVGDPPVSWFVRVSRVPNVKFTIQHLLGDGEWQIGKYTKIRMIPSPAHITTEESRTIISGPSF